MVPTVPRLLERERHGRTQEANVEIAARHSPQPPPHYTGADSILPEVQRTHFTSPHVPELRLVPGPRSGEHGRGRAGEVRPCGWRSTRWAAPWAPVRPWPARGSPSTPPPTSHSFSSAIALALNRTSATLPAIASNSSTAPSPST